MRKADKNKLWIIVSISLLFFLAGCVDTGVQVIPSTIDFTSQVKIVNLAAGMGTANITMKTESGKSIPFSAITFGSKSPLTTVPSGSAKLYITYNTGGPDTIQILAQTYYKMNFFLISSDGKKGTVIPNVSRYIQSAGDTSIYKKGLAQISFFNGSPDGSLTSVSSVLGNDTSAITLESSLGLGEGSGSYMELKPGNYTFILTASDGTTDFQTKVTANLTEKNRYTVIVYDKASSIKSTVLTDD